MATIVTVYGFEMDAPTSAGTVSTSTLPGNMAAGTYSYRITYRTRYGETNAGTISAIGTVVPVTPAITGSLQITNLPSVAVDYVAARRIYRTSVGNVAPYKFVAEITDHTVSTFLDTIADGSLGAEPPTANTAASNGKIYGNLFLERPIVHATVINFNATGADRATAADLPAKSEYVFVNTPIPNAGIVLPFTNADRVGLTVTIKNTSLVNALKIYPQDLLTSIDVGGPGVAYTLAGGSSVALLLTTAITWSKIIDSGAGAPPTGPAGGDLIGTYPDPTIALIQGVFIKAAVGTGNISFGVGSNNNAGTNNLAFGQGAGGAITTATGNVIFGTGAAPSLTTGTDNIVFGRTADVGAGSVSAIVMGLGAKNGGASATNNIFIGNGAGNLTMNSQDNVGAGTAVFASLTNGYRHVVMGTRAGTALTNATDNVFLGYEAGKSVTGSFENVGVGSGAMGNHINGAQNTVMGMSALKNNVNGNYNVAVGWQAMTIGTSGNQNTGVGKEVLRVVIGNNNSAFGFESGLTLTTGADNTFVGHQAGDAVVSGTQNVLLGKNTDAAAAATNTVGVGFGVTTTVDNEILVGNSSHRYFGLGGAGAIPSIHVPNNYYAQQAGVKVGGLYRTAENGATTTVANAITASFVASGTTLTVTAVGVTTLAPGQVLSGGTIAAGPPAIYIVAQLTGAAGDVGTYQVSQAQGIGTTCATATSCTTNPDILYIRTV